MGCVSTQGGSSCGSHEDHWDEGRFQQQLLIPVSLFPALWWSQLSHANSLAVWKKRSNALPAAPSLPPPSTPLRHTHLLRSEP